MTKTQQIILDYLEKSGWATAKQISAHTKVPLTSVRVMLVKMDDDFTIVSKSDPDDTHGFVYKLNMARVGYTAEYYRLVSPVRQSYAATS